LKFYETTNFFSDASDPITSLIKNEIDSELIERMGETQNRCCLAGVRLERDDLIQACLVHDGQTEKQLELTDMNECIERDVQPMKY